MTPRDAGIFRDYDSSATDAVELHFGNGLGTVLADCNARQAQKMGCYLLEKATDTAVLTAYTFDLPMITEALVKAASRGVGVLVIGDKDYFLAGVTATQPQRFDELRRGGVHLMLTEGWTGQSGIQHSKTLLTDGYYYLVGSTNWTNSSRKNTEVSQLVRLSRKGRQVVGQRHEGLMSRSEKLDEAQAAEAKATRSARELRRTQSAGAVPRSVKDLSFAQIKKRFSIARERQRSRTRTGDDS